MGFKIDQSLSLIGTPYDELIEAEQRYAKVREDLLRPIKARIEQWKEQNIPFDSLINQVFEGGSPFAVTKRYDQKNCPEGFDGNQYVLGNFFGKAGNEDIFTLQEEKLRIHLRSSLFQWELLKSNE